jgi:hypothetical protein
MTPRDFRAQVLQLCDYIEDAYAGGNNLIDWATMLAKAKQVRGVAFNIEEEHEHTS